MRAKVIRQCPQTTTFEEKGEPKQIRTEVSAYQPNALTLGQTGSLLNVQVCHCLYEPVHREDRSQSIVLCSLANRAKDSASPTAYVPAVYAG